MATGNERLEPRFRSANILRMFPTFVWKAELRNRVYQSINEVMLARLKDIEPKLDELKPGESWQSHHRLHELEGVQELVDCVVDATENVLGHLKIGHKGFRITGCWATVNGPNAGHRMHSHPNNYLSGVYYVQTQEKADTVNFHDPRPQIGILSPPVTELTAENTDRVVVKVQEGSILVFPAWLQHSVDPNGSNRARVSISFNIMLASYAEMISAPQWEPGWRQFTC